MSTVIEPVAAGTVPELAEQLVSVYTAAFGQPPYTDPQAAAERFAGSLHAHAARDGFRMQAARSASGAVVGFGYGYHSRPGQWWHDRVAGALGERAAALWLADAFELVELAVLPGHQRQGLGGALHDLLLRDAVGRRTAVLSTLDADTPARRLYRRRGWRPVGQLPPADIGRFVVMALELVGSCAP